MVRILSQQQVKELLSYKETIPVLETAFVDISADRAIAPPRLRMDIPQRQGRLSAIPAFVNSINALGLKIPTGFAQNPQKGLPTIMAIMTLHDAETGMLLAVMDGTYIIEAKTAVSSAVATKYLARAEASTLGIIGAGVQGRAHFMALSLVRNIQKVKVYNRSPENLERFMLLAAAERPELKVEVAESPRAAVVGSDIVVTASASPVPILKSTWLKPGAHVNAIGAWTPQTREIDSATVAAAKVVVDTRRGAMAEAGDILIPLGEGLINPDPIYAELGELISGTKRGRINPYEFTLYKSVGSAVLDISMAHLVYQRAVERNVGTVVEII